MTKELVERYCERRGRVDYEHRGSESVVSSAVSRRITRAGGGCSRAAKGGGFGGEQP